MSRINRPDKEGKNSLEDSALLRRKAEEILKKKTARNQRERDFTDEKALLNELQVHQIELEMQNEELKRARLEEEILHEKYVDLYDFAPVSYFTIDNKGTIIWVNLTGCRFLKYERQNLIGRRFQSFLIPENLPEFNSFCRNVLESSGKQICEVELFRDGQQRFFAHVEGMGSEREKGQIKMTVSDITERKNIEDTLRRSEERYRSLFSSMLNGFAVHEMLFDEMGKAYDYRFLDINPAFEELTGLSRDKVIGRTVLEVLSGIEPLWIKRYENVVLNGEPDYFEEYSHEIGKFFEVRVYRNAPHQFTTIFSDITERKRAEEALQQANNKLNLLSSITRHDILNGVTVLLGYIELASEEAPDQAMKDYLKKMDDAAETIQHQIEFTSEYQEIGVNAAVWQNVSEVVIKAGSTFSQDEVTLNIACGNVEIFADPLLQKVFYNLFDNAFRYAVPFTTITVTCDERGEELSLVFSDDGVGISAEHREHLFEKGVGKHTGLGLFLSREILAITGIKIIENGEPGKGARFEMTVPNGAYRFNEENDL